MEELGVLAALSLRIQAFWDLTLLGGCVFLDVAKERGTFSFKGQTASALKMALKSFETSRSTKPTTQSHIQKGI